MTSLHSQLLLAVRTEHLARSRWPGRPFHRNFPWAGPAPDNDLASFAWLCFEDAAGAGAVGVSIVDHKIGVSLYRVADWHGAADIRFSLWQYDPREGWREFQSSRVETRRPVAM